MRIFCESNQVAVCPVRAVISEPIVVNVRVLGSYLSMVASALAPSSPPTMRIWVLDKNVAV